MKTLLNHVAVLVESIESVLEKKLFQSGHLGEIEEFPAEGTRELYIGEGNQMGKLLLMQANGPGPYQNALTKRGAGLHHIAIDVLNIDQYVESISGSGWLLHPKSFDFYRRIKQVWLCRPGIPFLIEVNESNFSLENEYFIESLKLPIIDDKYIEALCCDQIKTGDEFIFKTQEREYRIRDLL